MTERSSMRCLRAPASRPAGTAIVPAVLLSWLIIAAPIALGQDAGGENPGQSGEQERNAVAPRASDTPRGSDTLPESDTPLEVDVPLSDATPPGEGGEPVLSLRDFRPRSQLQVASHPRDHAAFPVVDIHTHLFYKLRNNRQALDDFVAMMDRNGIAVCVSLDGRLGSRLDEHLEYLWSDYRNRFVVFANIDWKGDGEADDPATWACHRQGFAERTAQRLAEAVERGVSGLKIFKSFGLRHRNPDGSLIEIDDPRWDPIWRACGELGIPVIIHTADPAAFFDPIDATNERWEELSRHPDWSFHGDEYPSRKELLAARNRVIERHAETQFIGAHIANNPENLAVVSQWLDRYPNLWVEISSRIAELGRQPRTARRFLITYGDRVMFGTDGPWPEKRLHLYWRFLETADEYFPYSEKVPPPQGMWRIDGVDLPDDVLKKLYHQNAARLIPGVAQRVEAFEQRLAAQPFSTEPAGNRDHDAPPAATPDASADESSITNLPGNPTP